MLFWVVTQSLLLFARHPEVLQGAQIDTDGYMRLVRVERLVDTGAWFDGSIPRSNWPFGEDHHWTRPLDLLLITLALPFRLTLDWRGALAVAGAIVSPVCHLLICLTAMWAARPLFQGPERFLMLPAILVQPGLLGYGTAGRADHHALIFLLFVAALGAWIRCLLDPTRTGPAAAAGVLSGLGIWVSPESLLPLAVLLTSGGITWVLAGRRARLPNLFLCTGLVATVAVEIPLAHRPAAWLTVAYDQISIVHLTVALLALAFWWLMSRVDRREPGPQRHAPTVTVGATAPGWRLRLTLGVAWAIAAAALLRIIHPRFFRGPWADVDPKTIDLWLQYVQELQPSLPRAPADVGPFLMLLGPALVLIPVLGWWIRSDRTDPRRPIWLLLLLSLLVYVPLAARQMRFSGYVAVVTAILLVEAVRRILARGVKASAPSFRLRLARLGAMAGVLLGGLLVGSGVSAATAGADALESKRREAREAECSLRELSRVLADPDGLGKEQKTIAAYIDFGPELLYRTPHRVLAGPYHRNHQGILAAYGLITSANDEAARALVNERQVDIILLCPPVDRPYFARGGREALYSRLVASRGPQWIHTLRPPQRAPGAFLLFQVDRTNR